MCVMLFSSSLPTFFPIELILFWVPYTIEELLRQ